MLKILTIAELQTYNIEELRYLYRLAHEELALTNPGTPEREAAFATLENINQVLILKYQALRMGGPRF